MKTKKIMRFYFSADSLDRAFANLIMRRACDAASDAFAAAEGLCEIIGDRMRLEELWAYLDGVLSEFTERERLALSKYAAKNGADFVSAAELRTVKSAVNKFTRRARRLRSFADGVTTLDRYYCLLRDATV